MSLRHTASACPPLFSLQCIFLFISPFPPQNSLWCPWRLAVGGCKIIFKDLMFIFLLTANVNFEHSLLYWGCRFYLFFLLFFIMFLDNMWEIQNYAAAHIVATQNPPIHSIVIIEYRFTMKYHSVCRLLKDCGSIASSSLYVQGNDIAQS